MVAAALENNNLKLATQQNKHINRLIDTQLRGRDTNKSFNGVTWTKPQFN